MTPSQGAPGDTAPPPAPAATRRDFLSLAGRAALWETLGASFLALIRLLGFSEPQPPKMVTLDAPGTYPAGPLTSVAEGRAFIGRDARGLYALSAVCTHLGCPVRPRRRRSQVSLPRQPL